MNFAIAAAVFPIIFIGELPDKTMFASLVLSTRGKPFAVWSGAALAFAIHVAIATTVGVALFHVVPHRALEAIVAGLFLGGAGLALREGIRERQHEEREEKLVETEVKTHGRRTLTTSFIVIFVAEWGDLTQILTANLAARYHSPVSVGVGAGLALWALLRSRSSGARPPSSRQCHDRSLCDGGRTTGARGVHGVARRPLRHQPRDLPMREGRGCGRSRSATMSGSYLGAETPDVSRRSFSKPSWVLGNADTWLVLSSRPMSLASCGIARW